jgi:hypothetical protein
MAEKELKVGISLDRSGAKADAQAFRADQNALNQQLLADAKRAENAKAGVARDARAQVVAGSRAARTAVVADYKAQGDAGKSAFDKLRTSAESLFAGQGAGFAVASASFSKLIELVGAYGAAVTAAEAKRQKLTTQFTGQREDLAAVAKLMGRTADDQFTLEMGRFNKRTGFKPDEGRRFLESLYNEGAAYKGVKISEKEFGQLGEQAGQMALARGVDPSAVANMVGKQLGFKDYSKFGEQASEEVLGDTARALSILSAGSGSESQLIEEVNKLSAGMLSEDETRGVFHDNKDVAKYVSILASGFPQEQAQAGAAGIRSLRGFDKTKGGKFLKAAGVTPEDDPFEAIRKVGDYATEQAKLGPAGTTAQDVLTENFEDSLGARAIAMSYNIGVAGGQYAQREAVAAAEGGPAKALAANAAFLKSDRGLAREADADLTLAELEQGQKNAKVDILRKQAIADMTRSGELDAPGEKVQDFLAGTLSFGAIGDAEKRRIDKRALDKLRSRTPAGVLPPGQDLLAADPAIWEEQMRDSIQALEGVGLDPFHDKAAPEGPPAAAAPRGAAQPFARDADEHQAEMVQLLRSMDAKMGDPAQPPPPGPLVKAPEAIRR